MPWIPTTQQTTKPATKWLDTAPPSYAFVWGSPIGIRSGIPDVLPPVVYTPYEAAVRADNPSAYFRLGEASGTVAVDEMGMYNGTYVGGPTLGWPGALLGDPDTGVKFEDQRYVDVGNVLGFVGVSFCVEFWYKMSASDLSASAAWAPFVTKGDNTGGANAWRCARNTGNTQIQIAIGGFQANQAMFNDDTWRHIVFGYDASDGKIKGYQDGALATNVAGGPPQANGYPVRIAHNAQQTARNMKGKMDEVAIYDHMLSATRVAAHYAAATT